MKRLIKKLLKKRRRKETPDERWKRTTHFHYEI